jgi:hypothetical protein
MLAAEEANQHSVITMSAFPDWRRLRCFPKEKYDMTNLAGYDMRNAGGDWATLPLCMSSGRRHVAIRPALGASLAARW